jgi:hypothetical protein
MASESNTTEAEQEQALVSQAIDGDADWTPSTDIYITELRTCNLQRI